MNKFWLAVATFFGVGHAPIAPGTWASLVTTVTVYILRPHLSGGASLILALAVVVGLGIPAAAAAEIHYRRKDPGACVIDEVAGQMLCLIFIPRTAALYVTAFLLFRIIDILKPFPIRHLERIGGGWGIMIDDLAAGLAALALTRLLMLLPLWAV